MLPITAPTSPAPRNSAAYAADDAIILRGRTSDATSWGLQEIRGKTLLPGLVDAHGHVLRGADAWRTFLDQGTRIAGGSEFPVESDNPFFGLHAAVTRTDRSGQPVEGWHPEQAVTLVEAFRAFTLDAAYAQHQEKTIGSLEPGKWADFILIDRDLFHIPPADIWRIEMEQTWLAGERVY